MAKASWVTKAKRILGRNAIHISGDGQFAFITPCRDPAFSLWSTREEAETSMQRVYVCGSGCRGKSYHYIQNLGE